MCEFFLNLTCNCFHIRSCIYWFIIRSSLGTFLKIFLSSEYICGFFEIFTWELGSRYCPSFSVCIENFNIIKYKRIYIAKLVWLSFDLSVNQIIDVLQKYKIFCLFVPCVFMFLYQLSYQFLKFLRLAMKSLLLAQIVFGNLFKDFISTCFRHILFQFLSQLIEL